MTRRYCKWELREFVTGIFLLYLKFFAWRSRVWCKGGAQNYMKLFVAHKMTRNNTLNKVHVAATELPQLLSQNTKCLERQPYKVALGLCAAIVK